MGWKVKFLKHFDEEWDGGVIMQSDLKWSKQRTKSVKLQIKF
jgi:hypothetical protein